jgi:hypothetical protein
MLNWIDVREKLEVIWIVALLAAPIEAGLQRRRLEGKLSRFILLRFLEFGSFLSILAIAQTLEGRGLIPLDMCLFIILLAILCTAPSAYTTGLSRRDNVSKKSEP